jgi:tellurite resistance protein TehA-like permease
MINLILNGYSFLIRSVGTGVISALILNIPYGSPDVRWWVAFVFFILNVSLFFVFLAMSIVRYTLFPGIWSLMLHHPVQSLFLACFPMGFATLINASLSLFYTTRMWGGLSFLVTLWAFWWIDVVLSVASAVLLTYVMCVFTVDIFTLLIRSCRITRQNHSVETLNATWMLPIVPPIVASSTGGLLAYAWSTTDPHRALTTAVVSATMVVMGLSLALMMVKFIIPLFYASVYGTSGHHLPLPFDHTWISRSRSNG